jgi:hypothetical protein
MAPTQVGAIFYSRDSGNHTQHVNSPPGSEGTENIAGDIFRGGQHPPTFPSQYADIFVNLRFKTSNVPIHYG